MDINALHEMSLKLINCDTSLTSRLDDSFKLPLPFVLPPLDPPIMSPKAKIIHLLKQKGVPVTPMARSTASCAEKSFDTSNEDLSDSNSSNFSHTSVLQPLCTVNQPVCVAPTAKAKKPVEMNVATDTSQLTSTVLSKRPMENNKQKFHKPPSLLLPLSCHILENPNIIGTGTITTDCAETSCLLSPVSCENLSDSSRCAEVTLVNKMDKLLENSKGTARRTETKIPQKSRLSLRSSRSRNTINSSPVLNHNLIPIDTEDIEPASDMEPDQPACDMEPDQPACDMEPDQPACNMEPEKPMFGMEPDQSACGMEPACDDKPDSDQTFDSEIRESILKLNKWHIKPLLNGTYCVEGQIQQEGSCRAEHHLSGSIALRHSNTQVETVQGVRYRLVGRIQKTAALAAGIPKSTLHHFVKGIPSNWKEILDDALDGESTDTHQDSVNVSACQASGSKNAANSRLTDSIGKGSRDDPLTIDDLPKSRRSSRLKFPPLAFWTGQRVFVDPRTNVTTVMKGNDNAIPADMFYFEAADDTQLESTTTISRRSRKSCSPERTSVLESEQIESKTTSPGNKRKNSRVSSVESDQCKALETLDASESASPAKQKRGRTRKSNILAIAAGSVLETNVVAARSNVTASTNQHTSKSQQLREKIRSCTTSKQSKDDASSRTTRSVDKSSERTNRGFKIRDASDKNEKSSKKTQEADVSIRKHDKPTTRNGNKSATFSTSKTLGPPSLLTSDWDFNYNEFADKPVTPSVYETIYRLERNSRHSKNQTGDVVGKQVKKIVNYRNNKVPASNGDDHITDDDEYECNSFHLSGED